MKTYEKKIAKPKLVIEYDGYSESPRRDDNLGYFLTFTDKYRSPDIHDTLSTIIKEASQGASDAYEHMAIFEKEFNDTSDEKIIAIFPITKYEHGGVKYMIGAKQGFDYSVCGFYVVTDKTSGEHNTDKLQDMINAELNVYNKWANGDVFSFILYDDNGDVEDAMGGFYKIDNMKDYLPPEWEDEDLSEYVEV